MDSWFTYTMPTHMQAFLRFFPLGMTEVITSTVFTAKHFVVRISEKNLLVLFLQNGIRYFQKSHLILKIHVG